MLPIKRIQEEFQVYIWSCPCASLPFCITACHSGQCSRCTTSYSVASLFAKQFNLVFGLRSEEQMIVTTYSNISRPPKTKTCLLDATSNSLATSIGSFLPSLKTQYKTQILTTENKNDHISIDESTSRSSRLSICPTNSPIPVIPKESERSKRIQRRFEAFRVAVPSLIPKSFFGLHNLRHICGLGWTRDETWIRKSQPPSQRLRAKANKRRRKGPVTTFQTLQTLQTSLNHAVRFFLKVERQIFKIFEKVVNRVSSQHGQSP